MKNIYKHILVIIFLLSFAGLAKVENIKDTYSLNKFIVKTKTELKISEATGEISIYTGIKSLDEKNIKFKIKKIKKLFNLNNGDKYLYEKYGMSRFYVFYTDGFDKEIIKNIVKEYDKDDYVEFSELNYIGTAAGRKCIEIREINSLFAIPNDEMFSKQWYLKNDGTIQTSSKKGKIGADVNAINGWEIETGSDDVIVAILDSGIKFDHPDLKDNIWLNTKEIPENGIDDDVNGYTDDYMGWDFAYENNIPEDGFGHGTNIATVIAAKTNNGIGFAGINHKCKLMNCKNLSDDNYGEYIWWAESIKYAVDNGARIINMSEGGDESSKTLKTACDYAMEKGALIIAAMMNRGDDRDYFPASIKGVFAVGATDIDDTRCKRFTWGGGSCWGNHISVVAPGNKIYGHDYENIFNYDVYWSGTSQSTAIVSGLASLLLSQNKSRGSSDIKKIITSTARDQIGDLKEDAKGWDRFYGYGRVDLYLALIYELKPEVVKEKENEINKKIQVEESYEDRQASRVDGKAKIIKPEPTEPERIYDESVKPAKKQ